MISLHQAIIVFAIMALAVGLPICGLLAVLLVRGAKASLCCQGAEILTAGDADFLRPYVTDLDIAEAAEQREETRVRYEFLGQTGMEGD